MRDSRFCFDVALSPPSGGLLMTLPPPDVIEIECFCRGNNPGCVQCGGMGKQVRPACRRCHGKGSEGGRNCLDCRGQGWRPIDLPGWDAVEGF